MPTRYLDERATKAVLESLLAGRTVRICRREEAEWVTAVAATRLAVGSMRQRVRYLRNFAEILCGEAAFEKLAIPGKLEEHTRFMGLMVAFFSHLMGAESSRKGTVQGMSIVMIMDLLPENDGIRFREDVEQIRRKIDGIMDGMVKMHTEVKGNGSAENPSIRGLLQDFVAPGLFSVKGLLERVGESLAALHERLDGDWQLATTRIRQEKRC